MVRAGVHDHLVSHLGALQRGLDRLDLIRRNVGVLLAEQAEHAALDLGRAVERGLRAAGPLGRRDAAAVEARRRRDVGLAGGEVGHVAADAEAHRADLPAAHLGTLAQERGRVVRVGDRLVYPHLHQQLDAGGHAGLVVAELDAGVRAVEEVRREHDVALARDALGDVADVRVDSEDFLHDD